MQLELPLRGARGVKGAAQSRTQRRTRRPAGQHRGVCSASR